MLDDNHLRIVRAIDEALDSSPPLTAPIRVYRGLEASEIDFDVDLPFSAYVSTSVLERVALTRTGRRCCLLRITLVPGTHCLFIWDISEHRSEMEILLPRTGRFVLTSVTYEGDLRVYELVYVPIGSTPVSVMGGDAIPVSESEPILTAKIWAGRIYEMALLEMNEFGSSPVEAVDAVIGTMYSGENIPVDARIRAIELLETM